MELQDKALVPQGLTFNQHLNSFSKQSIAFYLDSSRRMSCAFPIPFNGVLLLLSNY